jgi:hypothetical protein
MPETWTIIVEGRSYGPYTTAQLQGFAAEGRVVPHSLVCPQRETQPRPASEFRELDAIFRAAAGPPGGRPPHPPTLFGRTRHTQTVAGERSQFLVVADMRSGSVAAVEAELVKLGLTFALMRETWIVASERTLNAIRHALMQKLGKRDLLFIVDATHNKAAWFNFGPETDARIRQVWNRPTETPKRP